MDVGDTGQIFRDCGCVMTFGPGRCGRYDMAAVGGVAADAGSVAQDWKRGRAVPTSGLEPGCARGFRLRERLERMRRGTWTEYALLAEPPCPRTLYCAVSIALRHSRKGRFGLRCGRGRVPP